MRAHTIIALFLAITLTTLSATRSPLSANTSSEVHAQSTIPMLTGTTPQQIDVGRGHQTSSARLFQATDTPGIDEMLSDIVARCDGVNRIVVAVDDSPFRAGEL